VEQTKLLWLEKTYKFPHRVYTAITKTKIETLVSFEELSLMTRHHDGYIREVAIVKLMKLFPSASIAYLVQLFGEYVMEIYLMTIAQIMLLQKSR